MVVKIHKVGAGGHSQTLFHLIALVIVGSILAHSSTDTLLADWFQQAQTDGYWNWPPTFWPKTRR